MDRRGNSLSPPRLPRYSTTNSGDDDDDSMVSDCESGVSGGEVIVRADVRSLESVGMTFIAGLGPLAPKIQVVSIQRHKFPTVISQARVDSFQIFARATAQHRHGNANVKHAWYSVSGMKEILEILQHGFSHDHGRGLRLSPEDCPLLSVRRSVADNDGLRHLMLCRVILGKMEVVPPGSDQCGSISDEYDSGVDDISSPKEYFIRSNRMNTHVLPEYVLSFKIPPTGRDVNVAAAAREPSRPKSPWVPFPELISSLSKILPPHDMSFVLKLQKDYRELKISRQQMIQKLRVIAGDKLLLQVIKSFREKLQKPPASCNKVKELQQESQQPTASCNTMKEWQPESQQPTASCNKVNEWQPESQQSGINNCPY